MYRRMRGELTLPHPMGLIHAEVEVRREGGPSRTVRFLVDSGASLSVLPWSVWHALGLKPLRAMRFSLADGRTMRRRISDCRFRFRGIDAPSPVILGQRRDVALLGTLTLEALGLVLHPFERTLRPMRMMLAAAAQETVGLPPVLEGFHSASG
jgi:clan AA aspartic protease